MLCPGQDLFEQEKAEEKKALIQETVARLREEIRVKGNYIPIGGSILGTG